MNRKPIAILAITSLPTVAALSSAEPATQTEWTEKHKQIEEQFTEICSNSSLLKRFRDYLEPAQRVNAKIACDNAIWRSLHDTINDEYYIDSSIGDHEYRDTNQRVRAYQRVTSLQNPLNSETEMSVFIQGEKIDTEKTPTVQTVKGFSTVRSP